MLNLYKKYIPLSISLVFSFLFFSLNALAQCPMCKAAAESNLKEGGTAALGLNTGILYLFLTPFAIAGTLIGLWFWFNRKQKPVAQSKEAEFDLIS